MTPRKVAIESARAALIGAAFIAGNATAPSVDEQLAATVPVVARECGGVRDVGGIVRTLIDTPQRQADVLALCESPGAPLLHYADAAKRAACAVSRIIETNEAALAEPTATPTEPLASLFVGVALAEEPRTDLEAARAWAESSAPLHVRELLLRVLRRCEEGR
jgi:hypothetical protein